MTPAISGVFVVSVITCACVPCDFAWMFFLFCFCFCCVCVLMPGPAASGLLLVKMRRPAAQSAGGATMTAELHQIQLATAERPECVDLCDYLS